jgi:hypothetical protein
MLQKQFYELRLNIEQTGLFMMHIGRILQLNVKTTPCKVVRSKYHTGGRIYWCKIDIDSTFRFPRRGVQISTVSDYWSLTLPPHSLLPEYSRQERVYTPTLFAAPFNFNMGRKEYTPRTLYCLNIVGRKECTLTLFTA